jgi:phosphoribosylformimino-5-aminoimidazole carboxamide ribotide isomerase
MKVIPVIDILGGIVVHAVGGNRATYKPIASCLTDSTKPVEVASAIRDAYGLSEIYVADLDAIEGRSPALDTLLRLGDLDFLVWCDGGVRDLDTAHALDRAGVKRMIAGLETLAGPRELAEICAAYGRDRVVFSLDLRAGKPCGDALAWGTDDPAAIAANAIDRGIGAVIVLDLARVGGTHGTGTEALCGTLSERFPGIEIVAGGGVRSVDDLRRLARIGVKSVLVGTALHDRRLSIDDWEEI